MSDTFAKRKIFEEKIAPILHHMEVLCKREGLPLLVAVNYEQGEGESPRLWTTFNSAGRRAPARLWAALQMLADEDVPEPGEPL